MTDAEKLQRARNLVRFLLRKMDREFDIRFRDGSDFFFVVMKKCEAIDVIQENKGTYRLTSKEQEEGHTGNPRHRGRHSR